MDIEQVIEFFGGKKRAADALSIAPANVTKWIKIGYIPISTQYEISRKSGFELEPDSATIYMEKRGYRPPETAPVPTRKHPY